MCPIYLYLFNSFFKDHYNIPENLNEYTINPDAPPLARMLRRLEDSASYIYGPGKLNERTVGVLTYHKPSPVCVTSPRYQALCVLNTPPHYLECTSLVLFSVTFLLFQSFFNTP